MSDQKNSDLSAPNETGSTAPTLVSDSTKKELSTLAGEAVSKLAEVAQEAGNQAKETATSLAVEAGENAKRLMNKQVGNTADFVAHVASSMKTAARSLDEHAPQLAKWTQGLASRADEFSASIRYQTVDELYATASDYARRQPTLVFGGAAACGFLLFRLFKAVPTAAEPQHQAENSGGAPVPSQQNPAGQY
jgi:hypothetical protein